MSGIIVFVIGVTPFLRFLFLMLIYGDVISGHLQSLIFGSVFMILGFLFVVMGIIADLLSINRKFLEDALYRLKKLEYDKN